MCQLRPLIEAMQRHYDEGSAFRVGIGTLCRRARVRIIQQIVQAVAEELSGVRFHLWGVKLATLPSRLGVPRAAGELR